MPALGAQLYGPLTTRARWRACGLGRDASSFLPPGRTVLGAPITHISGCPSRISTAEVLRGGCRVSASVANNNTPADGPPAEEAPQQMVNPMTGAAHDNRYWHVRALSREDGQDMRPAHCHPRKPTPTFLDEDVAGIIM